MTTQTDSLDFLYETYFRNKDENAVRVVSNMGVAIARVTKTEILEAMKKEFGNDSIDMEFSYIRNKHLNFSTYIHEGAISTGTLYVRVSAIILQYVVEVIEYKPGTEVPLIFYIEPIHEDNDDIAFMSNEGKEDFAVNLAKYLFGSFENYVNTI